MTLIAAFYNYQFTLLWNSNLFLEIVHVKRQIFALER